MQQEITRLHVLHGNINCQVLKKKPNNKSGTCDAGWVLCSMLHATLQQKC